MQYKNYILQKTLLHYIQHCKSLKIYDKLSYKQRINKLFKKEKNMTDNLFDEFSSEKQTQEGKTKRNRPSRSFTLSEINSGDLNNAAMMTGMTPSKYLDELLHVFFMLSGPVHYESPIAGRYYLALVPIHKHVAKVLSEKLYTEGAHHMAREISELLAENWIRYAKTTPSNDEYLDDMCKRLLEKVRERNDRA